MIPLSVPRWFPVVAFRSGRVLGRRRRDGRACTTWPSSACGRLLDRPAAPLRVPRHMGACAGAFPAFAPCHPARARLPWSWRALFSSRPLSTATPARHMDAVLGISSRWARVFQTTICPGVPRPLPPPGHGNLDSKPWSWLVAGRPILYYSSTDVDCLAGTCSRMIHLFGTPAIWWLTVPALAWAMWCLIIRRDRRFLIPVVAFTAGFLPWLIAYDRQMYFFYATALSPFIIAMLALAWATARRGTRSPGRGCGLAVAVASTGGRSPSSATWRWLVAMFLYWSRSSTAISSPKAGTTR